MALPARLLFSELVSRPVIGLTTGLVAPFPRLTHHILVERTGVYSEAVRRTQKHVDVLARRMGHHEHIQVVCMNMPHKCAHIFTPATVNNKIYLPPFWLKGIDSDDRDIRDIRDIRDTKAPSTSFERDLQEGHLAVAQLALQTPGAYDFVLGHEIAHIMYGDNTPRRMLLFMQSLMGVGLIALGHPLFCYLHMLTAPTQSNVLLNSIERELRADRVSAALLSKSEREGGALILRALADVHSRLLRKHMGLISRDETATIMSSHPSLKQRLDQLTRN